MVLSKIKKKPTLTGVVFFYVYMTDLEQIKYLIKIGGYCNPELNCDFCIIYKTHNKCLSYIIS